MPDQVLYTASVPYGDTFLLVGGLQATSKVPLNAIYEYDAHAEQFKLVSATSLRTARHVHEAIMVDADAFPPCE